MAAQLALKMDISLQQDEEPSTMVDVYVYVMTDNIMSDSQPGENIN